MVVQIEDKFTNPLIGGSVILEVSPSGVPSLYQGGVGSTSLAGTTNLSGQASFSSLSMQKAGTFTLTAASAGLTSAISSSFKIIPGSAAQSYFSFVQQPTNTTAGSTISPSVSVLVADTYGNALSGVAVTMGISPTPASYALAGTLTVATNASGLALFTNLVEDSAATYTLSASLASTYGLTAATSNPFTIVPTTETITFLTGSGYGPPSTAGAGVVWTNPVEVVIQDKYYNKPADNTPVALAISTPGTLNTGNLTAYTSSGLASFTGLSVDKMGTFTLTASASSLGATSSPSSKFVITAGAPVSQQFSFVTQPHNATAGNTIAAISNSISSYVAVKVGDTFGNGVAGVNVTMAISPTPASYALAGTLTVATNASGLALFSNLVEDSAATYTLSASVASTYGLTAATSDSFIIVPTTEKLTFTTPPPTPTVAGNPMSTPVVVLIEDKFGNPPAVETNVTLTVSTGGVPLFLYGASNLGPPAAPITVATDSTGQASFIGLSMEKAGTFTLTATSSGLTSAVSSKFAITASTPYALSLVNQPQSQTAGSSIKTVTLQVVDQFGNPCAAPSGDVVSMSVASGPASSLSNGAGPISFNANGQAVFNAMTEDTAGTYTLWASDTLGLLGIQTNAFVISPSTGYLTYLAAPSGTPGVAAGADLNLNGGQYVSLLNSGTTLPSGVTYLLADSYGNPIPNSSVSVRLASGTLSTPSNGVLPALTTNSLGLVTFSTLTEDKVGSYTLKATPKSYATHTALSPFSIIASDAYGLTFSVQPTNTQATKTINAVTVQIVDAYGNPVGQSDMVSLALSSATVTFVGGNPAVQTSSSGSAVFSGLQVTTTGIYTMVATTTIADNQGNSKNVFATSKSFKITPGPAVSMVFTTQPANGQYVNSLLGATTGAVVVQLLDQYGNNATQPNVPVTFTITNMVTGMPYGTKPTKRTNSLGQAVVSLMLFAAGTYELTASSSAGLFTPVLSNPFAVTQAPTAMVLTTAERPEKKLADRQK